MPLSTRWRRATSRHQQRRADRQNERQRHLDHDERVAQSRVARPQRRWSAGILGDRLEIDARRGHGRRQAKKDRDHDGGDGEKRERAPVERDLVGARDFRRRQRHQQPRAPASDEGTGHAARRRQQQALGRGTGGSVAAGWRRGPHGSRPRAFGSSCARAACSRRSRRRPPGPGRRRRTASTAIAAPAWSPRRSAP